MIDEEEESPQLPDDSEEIIAQTERLFQEGENDDNDRIRQVQQQERGRKGRTEAEDQEFFEQSEWLKNKIDNEVGQWANQRMEQRRIENQKILPPSPPKFEESFATYPVSKFSKEEPYPEDVPPQKQQPPSECPPVGYPTTLDVDAVLSGTYISGAACGTTEFDVDCDIPSLCDISDPSYWIAESLAICSADCNNSVALEFTCPSPCSSDDPQAVIGGATLVWNASTLHWSIRCYMAVFQTFCDTELDLNFSFEVDIGTGSPIGTHNFTADDGTLHGAWTVIVS